MTQAPKTLDGWYTYHDFRTMNWSSWKSLSSAEQKQATNELFTWIHQCEQVDRDGQGSFGVFAIAGHKADFLFLHMRPTVEELIQLKHDLNQTQFADHTQTPYSYVSVVELGGYLAKPGVDVETDAYLQGRLKPKLPEMSHVCFYPMNKKREGNDNWYSLSGQERANLMRSHGEIGRTYAESVKQIVTGSMGLDDWEWGVTLFSDDPLQFKKIVYEMRFDEVSARYGEFGPFLVGHRLSEEEIYHLLKVHLGS